MARVSTWGGALQEPPWVLGDVCPHSLRHNVNLNKYFKCKMYIVLDFLSQCDEATNNKNLSKRPQPLRNAKVFKQEGHKNNALVGMQLTIRLLKIQTCEKEPKLSSGVNSSLQQLMQF